MKKIKFTLEEVARMTEIVAKSKDTLQKTILSVYMKLQEWPCPSGKRWVEIPRGMVKEMIHLCKLVRQRLKAVRKLPKGDNK